MDAGHDFLSQDSVGVVDLIVGDGHVRDVDIGGTAQSDPGVGERAARPRYQRAVVGVAADGDVIHLVQVARHDGDSPADEVDADEYVVQDVAGDGDVLPVVDHDGLSVDVVADGVVGHGDVGRVREATVG